MPQNSPEALAPEASGPSWPDARPRKVSIRDRTARRLSALVRMRTWATSPHPEYEQEWLREFLERRDERRYLAQTRAGRDVCWPVGADVPDPLVTVRIATYSRGREILRTLDSVLAQTHRNLEVLVLGDHCDEATEDAVREVDDPRLRFVNLPTRGLYPEEQVHRWRVAGTHPMNAGLVLASGAWIAPCDDDDVMTPTHVEHLLEHALARRLEMVWSRAALREGDDWVLTGPRFVHGEISHGSVLYSSALRFFRHSNTSWKLGEPGDWNLWRRMKAAGVRIGWLDELTYYHY